MVYLKNRKFHNNSNIFKIIFPKSEEVNGKYSDIKNKRLIPYIRLYKAVRQVLYKTLIFKDKSYRDLIKRRKLLLRIFDL